MYGNQPLAHRYRETAIKTASPLQLIVILYDGAIQSLQEAQAHIERKNIAGRGRAVNRAVAIISELQASLNIREGGQIAESLDSLYNYMKERVFAGNLQQNPEPFKEVTKLLENLRSAWSEVAARSQPAPNVAPAAPPVSVRPELMHDNMKPTGTLGSFSICG